MMFREPLVAILAGIVVAALFYARTPAVAAPFANLNFEQSTVQPGDPDVVPTSAAFPSWTAKFGNTISANVHHDYTGGGIPILAVFDQPVATLNFRLLQGNYMAYVDPGVIDQITSLSQLGDIPLGTRSMALLCDGGAGPPVVKIDGTTIPFIYRSGISENGFINTYAADVTAYAGTTVELRLESATFHEPFGGKRAFDDIRFSETPLPEPNNASCSLICILTQFARRPRSGQASTSLKGRNGSQG